jgi:hypothetical protein
MSTEAASQTYTGGCHCQANRYSVVLSPPLDKKHTVITCNCSICEINGYMLAFTDPDKITWTEGGARESEGLHIQQESDYAHVLSQLWNECRR